MRINGLFSSFDLPFRQIWQTIVTNITPPPSILVTQIRKDQKYYFDFNFYRGGAFNMLSSRTKLKFLKFNWNTSIFGRYTFSTVEFSKFDKSFLGSKVTNLAQYVISWRHLPHLPSLSCSVKWSPTSIYIVREHLVTDNVYKHDKSHNDNG